MELSAQLVSFLMTLAVGLTLGLLFDFYRVMRGVFRPRAVLTSVLDGAYWLFALALTFLALLMSDWAELRFYTFLGLLAGGVFYFRVLSRCALLCILRVLRLAFGCWRRVRSFLQCCVLRPLGYALGIFTLPLRRVVRAARAAQRRRRQKPTEKAADGDEKNR